jgi:hypothetical protein
LIFFIKLILAFMGYGYLADVHPGTALLLLQVSGVLLVGFV